MTKLSVGTKSSHNRYYFAHDAESLFPLITKPRNFIFVEEREAVQVWFVCHCFALFKPVLMAVKLLEIENKGKVCADMEFKV